MPADIIDDYKGKHKTIQIARELSQKYDIIIAAGGDGTIADVIQGITEAGMGKKVALGVIPLGSGNAFRESIGIPRSIRKSLQIIMEGYTRTIDLIDIEGKYASFGSVGATAQVTLENLKNKIPGLLGHLIASRLMFTFPRKLQEVELIDGIDDQENRFDRKILNLKAYDCIIGKTNHFGYSWKAAPMAKLDDGYIDITFFETSGFQYFLLFPSIYLGSFQKTQKHFKAKKVILKGKDLPIQYHGEGLGIKDTIKMSIIPHALKVITSKKKLNMN